MYFPVPTRPPFLLKIKADCEDQDCAQSRCCDHVRETTIGLQKLHTLNIRMDKVEMFQVNLSDTFQVWGTSLKQAAPSVRSKKTWKTDVLSDWPSQSAFFHFGWTIRILLDKRRLILEKLLKNCIQVKIAYAIDGSGFLINVLLVIKTPYSALDNKEYTNCILFGVSFCVRAESAWQMDLARKPDIVSSAIQPSHWNTPYDII